MNEDSLGIDGLAEEEVVSRQSRICAVLGNPTRLRILYCLIHGGPRSPSELAKQLGISRPLLSQHVTQLRSVGAIESRREGRSVKLSLAAPEIGQACALMRSFLLDRLRRQGEIARHLEEAVEA